jgi:hypothetical protein
MKPEPKNSNKALKILKGKMTQLSQLLISFTIVFAITGRIVRQRNWMTNSCENTVGNVTSLSMQLQRWVTL